MRLSPLSLLPVGAFWRAPRQTRVRRWIFNIHFYAGLIAGLLWLVVGITGALIVFIPELRRLEVPGWTRVDPSGQPLPIETLVMKLLKDRPGDRMHSIYWDFKPTWGVNFRTVAPNGERIHSFIDPYRGRVLDSVNYNHSALQWFYDLHADLLSGTIGRKVNAWFAFALTFATTSGLLLWWRGVRKWKLGFEYRLQASWKRQTWDLHNVGGFFFYLPLLLLALTGAYYAYGSAYASVAAALTGGPAHIPPPRIAPLSSPRRSLDEIAASGLRALPGSTLSMIIFPVSRDDPFTLRLKLSGDLHRIGLNWVYVDQATARVLRVDKFGDQPLGVKIIRLMTPLHYGTIAGYATRVLWLLSGLMPGVLFVTSLLMWWNRSLSKKGQKKETLHAQENLQSSARTLPAVDQRGLGRRPDRRQLDPRR
jgi:uncharacterized iron-regulated membrane protein